MDHLNDHHAKYLDGSGGGAAGLLGLPFRSLFASNRYESGLWQGEDDAQSLIASLARDKNGNIVETIKVITHSMGAAYAKGYIKAILDYAKAHNIVGVIFEFEADYAAYQPIQHSIFSFFQQIMHLPTGTYHVINGQIVPDN